MKKIGWFCCLILILCGSCGRQSKRHSQEPLQPLSVGVMATMDGLPFLVADEEGIYDSLGLSVDFNIFVTETDRDASFEAHRIEGMVTDYSSAAVLQSKGIPLRAIMQNDGYLCLLTGRESKINSISQLKNINFCTSRNSFSQYAADVVLHKAGLTSEMVNQPEVSQVPLRMMMLETSQIDATFLPDPYATIAMNSGAHSLMTTEDLHINQMTTVFSRIALEDKEASVRALIKGYNLAVDYMVSHPNKDWAGVLTNKLRVPENLVNLIVFPSYRHAQKPNMAEVAKAIDWLKSKKIVKTSYDGMELVDTNFVDRDSVPIRKTINKLLHHHRYHVRRIHL